MEFIRREEPYSGYVIRTVENGKSYRVARKFPDDPESLALCDYQIGGSGWYPVRDLTEEEKAQYRQFIAAVKK